MRSKLHVTPSPNLLNLAALLDPLGASPAHEHRIDWEEVYRLSALHLVTPILYQRLAETDRLADVPQDVRDALRHVFDLNAERNERQRRILHDTVRFLNEAGMEPLLLKGAVSLLPSQGPYAAARMLSDIDVLVPNVPPEAAAKVLLERGYTHMPGHEPRDSASCSHHLAPLFHPAGHGYVEIHRRASCPRGYRRQFFRMRRFAQTRSGSNGASLASWCPRSGTACCTISCTSRSRTPAASCRPAAHFGNCSTSSCCGAMQTRTASIGSIS